MEDVNNDDNDDDDNDDLILENEEFLSFFDSFFSWEFLVI